MMLRSHGNNVVDSNGNVTGEATTSAAAVPEQSGPGIARNLLVDASNPLPHGIGALPQMNEVTGNDSDGAAAQASNLGVLNRAAVDGDNLLANPAHNVVQQGDGSFVFHNVNNIPLLNPFEMPHVTQVDVAGGEGDENLDTPREDEAEESEDSDSDNYVEFTPAEVMERLYKYKRAYRAARRHRIVAEDQLAELNDEYGDLQTARNTQDEYVHQAQEESDAIKCGTENFRVCAEFAMNEEQVAHQSRILEYNEQTKNFEARKKQFEADEALRLLREAEWQQRENSEWLKGLQHSRQLAQQKVAAGRSAAPTAPLQPNLPPPPRMEQATAGMHQVSTAEQQRARQEAVVITKETAYRQLIADLTINLNGPQAQALLAEALKLRAEYTCVHLSGSTAAPAVPLDAGAGIATSTGARVAPSELTAPVQTSEQRKDHRRKQLTNHWKQVQNFLAACPTTNLVERQEAYDNYLDAVTQFELDYPSGKLSANIARCRSETNTVGAGVRSQMPTSQSARPAVQQQVFQNSSLPIQNDLLDPGLAATSNRTPILPNTQFADNGVDDEGRVQHHDPPPREFQPGNGWYNPNLNGYYQPMQTYPSPDPIVQHAFDQECYAARLANHYQSVAKEKVAHAEQEIERLHQTIQQQSMLPAQSPLTAPAQSSTPNADVALAGQLAPQVAASAAPPVLSQSDMTIPVADLPTGTYSIYCPPPDPATVTQYSSSRRPIGKKIKEAPLCFSIMRKSASFDFRTCFYVWKIGKANAKTHGCFLEILLYRAPFCSIKVAMAGAKASAFRVFSRFFFTGNFLNPSGQCFRQKRGNPFLK